MNWTIFGAVGEVVGAAGVVASLVYVARQVGFSARQSQLHNRRQASAVILAAIDHIAADDDIASIYARGTRGFHD